MHGGEAVCHKHFLTCQDSSSKEGTKSKKLEQLLLTHGCK